MKDPFELNAKSIMALYELFPTEEACIKHQNKFDPSSLQAVSK